MKPIQLVSPKGRRFQACDQDLTPELERLAIWRRPLIAQVSVESSVRLVGFGMGKNVTKSKWKSSLQTGNQGHCILKT